MFISQRMQKAIVRVVIVVMSILVILLMAKKGMIAIAKAVKEIPYIGEKKVGNI